MSRAITLVRRGWPWLRWYCRTNLRADSAASDPELTKNTTSRSPGASPAMVAAASAAAGCAADQVGA
jgi:hypothetical protein